MILLTFSFLSTFLTRFDKRQCPSLLWLASRNLTAILNANKTSWTVEIIGDLKFDYEYEIEYENDFSNRKRILKLTVRIQKPWTQELFLECYCGVRKKQIRFKMKKKHKL